LGSNSPRTRECRQHFRSYPARAKVEPAPNIEKHWTAVIGQELQKVVQRFPELAAGLDGRERASKFLLAGLVDRRYAPKSMLWNFDT
jgi:hypothetical protein